MLEFVFLLQTPGVAVSVVMVSVKWPISIRATCGNMMLHTSYLRQYLIIEYDANERELSLPSPLAPCRPLARENVMRTRRM